MFIPPYFPEPLVVPNNVADSAYDERLRFLRLVIAGHAATVAFALLVALFWPWRMAPQVVTGALLGALILHSLVRKLLAGLPQERLFQIALLPITLILTGLFGRELHDQGWPVLALPIGVLGGAVYTAISGRDFSFVGNYVLSGVFTIAGCFAATWIWPQNEHHPWLAALIGLVALFYLVYDLAMVLKRRRHGDEFLAVCDLYCDVLNLFSYIPRVIQHWKRFAI